METECKRKLEVLNAKYETELINMTLDLEAKKARLNSEMINNCKSLHNKYELIKSLIRNSKAKIKQSNNR